MWPALTVKNLCKESCGELVLYPRISLCSPTQLCVLAGKDHSYAEDRWHQGVLSNRWACNQGLEFPIQNLCRKISSFKKIWRRSIFTALPRDTTRQQNSEAGLEDICLSEHAKLYLRSLFICPLLRKPFFGDADKGIVIHRCDMQINKKIF